MDSLLDRRTVLKLGAAALAVPAASSTAQDKPGRGGTLTIGPQSRRRHALPRPLHRAVGPLYASTELRERTVTPLQARLREVGFDLQLDWACRRG